MTEKQLDKGNETFQAIMDCEYDIAELNNLYEHVSNKGSVVLDVKGNTAEYGKPMAITLDTKGFLDFYKTHLRRLRDKQETLNQEFKNI